jgi:hypothetical protein
MTLQAGHSQKYRQAESGISSGVCIPQAGQRSALVRPIGEDYLLSQRLSPATINVGRTARVRTSIVPRR